EVDDRPVDLGRDGVLGEALADGLRDLAGAGAGRDLADGTVGQFESRHGKGTPAGHPTRPYNGPANGRTFENFVLLHERRDGRDRFGATERMPACLVPTIPGFASYVTFFNSVTRPVCTHSTTKMLPSLSKQASCGWTNLPPCQRDSSARTLKPASTS